ncbi:hypothetical protein T484DRAFT_1823284, partial [Baffinella frigidus]
WGHLAIVNQLLNKGADIDRKTPSPFFFAPNFRPCLPGSGWTPEALASANQHCKVAGLLGVVATARAQAAACKHGSSWVLRGDS